MTSGLARLMSGSKGKNIMKENIVKVGDSVEVIRQDDDIFENDFQGTVKQLSVSKNTGEEFIVVEDQDGDCWDCSPEQVRALEE